MKKVLINRSLFLFSFLAAFLPIAAKTHYWNNSRGYNDFNYATPEGIKIENKTSTPLSDCYIFNHNQHLFTLSFRAANLNANPSKSYEYMDADGRKLKEKNPAWEFLLFTANGDTLSFHIIRKELDRLIESQAGIEISVHSGIPGFQDKKIIVENGLDCYSSFNFWRLTVSENSVLLEGGNHISRYIGEIFLDHCPYSGFGFKAFPGANLVISDIKLEIPDSYHNHYPDNVTELMNMASDSDDPLTGKWTVFDRTLEESLLRLGGDYRFVILKNDLDACYDIVYIEGAKTNHKSWHAGMIKGRLIPTYFNGVFDVEWIDSEGKMMNHEIKAQTGEGNTLTLHFPFQSSHLRLRKYED